MPCSKQSDRLLVQWKCHNFLWDEFPSSYTEVLLYHANMFPILLFPAPEYHKIEPAKGWLNSVQYNPILIAAKNSTVWIHLFKKFSLSQQIAICVLRIHTANWHHAESPTPPTKNLENTVKNNNNKESKSNTEIDICS